MAERAKAPIDSVVAQVVLAGSASVAVGILLITARTLGGHGPTHLAGDLAVLLLWIGAAGLARMRRLPWPPWWLSPTLLALGVIAGAVLHRFDGIAGPAPGPAVFAWARLSIAAAALVSSGAVLIARGRWGPPAWVVALLPGYWLLALLLEQMP